MRLLLIAANLIFLPPDHDKPDGPRAGAQRISRAFDQQIDALVGLQGPVIEYDFFPVQAQLAFNFFLQTWLCGENDLIIGDVLDQQAGDLRIVLAHIVLQLRTDGDHRAGGLNGPFLQPGEQRHQRPGAGVFEIGQLLRQRRVHVVQMGQFPAARQTNAEKPRFFMGVQQIIVVFLQQTAGPDIQCQVERHLGFGRADAHAAHARHPGSADNPQPLHRHILAYMIGRQINLMAEGGQRFDAMQNAKRRAARLKPGLRGNHQQAKTI
ncbi:MAG: hypothetical protein BWY83_01699 [bacterium ADurb.Bin478]|nr:MAG: hypothetical protein BWY83_01699 [bacterium ADurb.Bin478]